MKENVVSLATTPVDRFANISASGLSESEQASLVKLALSVLWERYRPGELLTSPDATRDFLRLLLSERKNDKVDRHIRLLTRQGVPGGPSGMK